LYEKSDVLQGSLQSEGDRHRALLSMTASISFFGHHFSTISTTKTL
jgi:hypothetical protein